MTKKKITKTLLNNTQATRKALQDMLDSGVKHTRSSDAPGYSMIVQVPLTDDERQSHISKLAMLDQQIAEMKRSLGVE